MGKNNDTSAVPQIAGDLCGCWRDMTEEKQAAKYNPYEIHLEGIPRFNQSQIPGNFSVHTRQRCCIRR